MTYLGIDYGRARWGLALAGDATPAVPLGVMRMKNPELRTKNEECGMKNVEWGMRKVIEVVRRERIDAVVVGIPQSLQYGQRGTLEHEVEVFIKALKHRLEIPVYGQDERFTSAHVASLKREYGSSGQKDAVAAMLILQSWLDRIRTVNYQR